LHKDIDTYESNYSGVSSKTEASAAVAVFEYLVEIHGVRYTVSRGWRQ